MSICVALLTLGVAENQDAPSPTATTTVPHDHATATLSPSGEPSEPEVVAPLARSAPVSLSIPAIELHTTDLVELGLTTDRRLQDPPEWQSVGWFTHGATPGQTGPAVMAGHLDSTTGPAVFHRLGELHPGDQASVRRADGTSVEFTVYAVESHPKDAFPTERVYGDTREPELRLITCGGAFDPATGHYADNVIAYARIAGTHPRH